MDIKLIKNLVELMVENDLSRIELREGDSHILLRRGHPVVASAGTQVLSPGYAVPSAAAGNPGTPAGASPAAAEVAKEASIRSPMVGTFYAAAEPEAPPYVSAGSVVTPDTVVCLIEAMKVFNEIKAEVSGRITKVLVKNAEAVEFDQPLFAIAPE
jgi:acetyl-CoA carboxylase biotin carboxyl carrier protein